MSATLPSVHSRDSRGTALYEKFCSLCGAASIVDKRRLNCVCKKCSGVSRRTHGLSVGGKLHPLYKLLIGIKARCDFKSATNYAYYGGRGITVCQEWRNDPLAFVSWAEKNGWDNSLEVDRIDVDGDYSPENCRLISHQENSQRTRRIKTTHSQVKDVRQFLADGLSIKDAAKKAQVTYMIAWHIKNSPGVWSNV